MALAVAALAQSAWAQGCALCYTSASALNKSGIHALDKGIIVLFIPPVLIFAGIFAFLYIRRHAWAPARHDDDFVLEFDRGAAPPAFPSGRRHSLPS
jgi:hypothetical protein